MFIIVFLSYKFMRVCRACKFSDLLAVGRTTGQLVVRLFDPVRHQKEEEEAAKAKEAEEQAKTNKKGKAESEKVASKDALKKGKKEPQNKQSTDADKKSASSPNHAQSPLPVATASSPTEQLSPTELLDVQSPEQDIDRNWFGLVCYGLPNLAVGTIGKS
jgi:uncharacterized membrane protein